MQGRWRSKVNSTQKKNEKREEGRKKKTKGRTEVV